VSSLWTPSGEHRVPRQGTDTGTSSGTDGESGAPPQGGGDAGGPPQAAGPGGPEQGYPSPEEEEAIKAQLAELSQRLASAPPEEIIANHAYGMFELAAIHLSRRPPNLQAGRLAIDALAALVDTLGDRLGQHAASLREALSQIRLAYVQIASADLGPSEESSAEQAGPEQAGPAEAGHHPAHAKAGPEDDTPPAADVHPKHAAHAAPDDEAAAGDAPAGQPQAGAGAGEPPEPVSEA
jgi:hypothetical protein